MCVGVCGYVGVPDEVILYVYVWYLWYLDPSATKGNAFSQRVTLHTWKSIFRFVINQPIASARMYSDMKFEFKRRE